MKSIPLAMACALLGASALTPAAYAQTTGGSSGMSEISPSTSQPDVRRDWRSRRDEDETRATSNRDSTNRSYGEEEDDVEPGTGTSARRAAQMGGPMGGPMGMKDHEMMRMHANMMRAHHRGGMEAGARLHLKRGDSAIDIRCPEHENIAACVDAVGKLMDRLQNMPGAASTTTRP